MWLPPSYLLLLATQFFSTLTSEVLAVALALHLYGESGSLQLHVAMLVATTLPGLLLLLTAGTVVDKCGPAVVMIVADSISLCVAWFMLSTLPSATAGHKWAWLITYAAASSGAAAVQWPAADACIARLVPPGLHQRANGAAEASEAVAEVCAPLAGGLAVWALGGVRAILWMDTCTCCIAIGIVLLLRPALRQPDKAVAARKQQQQHGLATYMAIVRLPQVAQPLWFAFTTSLFESAAGALLLPYVLSFSTALHFGAVGAAIAAGMLVGALATSATPAPALPVAAGAALGLLQGALLLLAVAVHPTPLRVGLVGCLYYAGRAFQRVWLQTMLQASTASSKHGRVFAARDWVASLGEVCGPLALLPLSLGVGSVVAGAASSGNLPLLQRSLAALGVVHIAMHTAFLLGARGKKAGGRKIE